MNRDEPPTMASAQGHAGHSPAKFAACGLLILIPVVLALTVPLYQRTDPKLAGIPFFFWWQMLMAVAAACATGATYMILFRNDPEDDA